MGTYQPLAGTYQHQTGSHQPLTGTHLSLPVRLKPIRGTKEPLKYVSNRENSDFSPIIFYITLRVVDQKF
jgi:hypothetical protein